MITFKNQCSIKGMKQLKDQSVNLIVTDPPYNIADDNKLTMQGNRFISTKKAWGFDFQDKWNSFEEYYEWLKPFFAEMKRVLKDDGSMIIFLDRNFASTIGYLLQKDFGLIVKNKLYFNKTTPLASAHKKNYRSCIEEAIWVSKSPKCKLNFINQTDMKQVFSGATSEYRKKKRIHPCMKYTWMIQPLIERHSEPGDVVLDPFAGSGTTLKIANDMGREAIGFEKSADFFYTAYFRLFGVFPAASRMKSTTRVKIRYAAANEPMNDEDAIKRRAREIADEMIRKYKLSPVKAA